MQCGVSPRQSGALCIGHSALKSLVQIEVQRPHFHYANERHPLRSSREGSEGSQQLSSAIPGPTGTLRPLKCFDPLYQSDFPSRPVLPLPSKRNLGGAQGLPGGSLGTSRRAGQALEPPESHSGCAKAQRAAQRPRLGRHGVGVCSKPGRPLHRRQPLDPLQPDPRAPGSWHLRGFPAAPPRNPATAP